MQSNIKICPHSWIIQTLNFREVKLNCYYVINKKYLNFRGVILGAKVTEYLLEKSRIVTQAPEERNYHVFYELLAGLADEEKLKYGLLSADKYFYLNQGGNCEIDGKYDGEDFQSLMSAMQVLGFTSEEQDTIFRILASGKISYITTVFSYILNVI